MKITLNNKILKLRIFTLYLMCILIIPIFFNYTILTVNAQEDITSTINEDTGITYDSEYIDASEPTNQIGYTDYQSGEQIFFTKTQDIDVDAFNLIPSSVNFHSYPEINFKEGGVGLDLLDYDVEGYDKNGELIKSADGKSDDQNKYEMRIEKSAPYINENEIQQYSTPQTLKKSNGEEYVLYQMKFPIEYEYVWYTTFDYEDINPYHFKIETSEKDESEICIGRVYIGDELTTYKQIHGVQGNDPSDSDGTLFLNGQSQTNAQDPKALNYARGGKYWVSDNDLPNNRYRANWYDEKPDEHDYNDFKFYYWNDGRDDFKTHEKYGSYNSYVPYMKLGNEDVDGTDIINNDFIRQKNVLTNYITSSDIDKGYADLIFKFNMNPINFGQTENVLDEETNKITQKSLSWLKVTSVEILPKDNTWGYLGELNEETLQDVAFSDFQSVVKNAEGNSVDKDTEIDRDIADTWIGGSVYYITPTPPFSTYTLSDQVGGDHSYGANPRLYSIENEKFLDEYTITEQEQQINENNWEIHIQAARITPRIQIIKKNTVVNYKEEWWDHDIGNYQLWDKHSESIAFQHLAGIQVVNTYIIQRFRIWVRMFSAIPISDNPTIQPSDRLNNTQLEPPDNPIGVTIWDSSNYGTIVGTDLRTHGLSNVGQAIKAIGEFLNEFWEKYWLQIIIIIALVAVIGIVGLKVYAKSTGADMELPSLGSIGGSNKGLMKEQKNLIKEKYKGILEIEREKTKRAIKFKEMEIEQEKLQLEREKLSKKLRNKK